VELHEIARTGALALALGEHGDAKAVLPHLLAQRRPREGLGATWLAGAGAAEQVRDQ
jgi:hypothetical protein